MKYKFLPHTADVKFIAYGKNESELIENAALAMFSTITHIKNIKRNEKKYIIKKSFSASSIDELIWKILQHTLSFADSKNLFCYNLNVLNLSKKNTYKAVVKLFLIDKSEIYANRDVKGISKYSFIFKHNKKILSITAVLDV
ncbi:MAG: archease [Candidatus Marsarchaeota archaeon]|nr:archease [Candidatus Marsarchaeota archaeon]